MKKSPRLELILMAVLLVLTMLAYIWMQRRAIKGQKPSPEVAIQDGKTIDFSSGRPVIKDDAKQKAALEKSLKEMDAAAKNVTFAPRQPAGTKAAEPVKP